MMRFPLRAAITAVLFAAAPVLAQLPPQDGGPMGPGPEGRAQHGGMMGKRMFGAMSDAGRATMMEAMKASRDPASHDAVKAARERMLAVLDADRLDTAALKRAMDDERMASNANRERVQASMLAGFARLTPTDRKAFVADARQMKAHMEERMGAWRKPRGSGGDTPPPPPPGM